MDKPYQVLIDLGNYICNLEYPICQLKNPVRNKVFLGQKNSFLLDTFPNKPVAVSLANNHIFDFGEEGFLQTLNYLDRNDIPYFGAGNKKNNYNNPFIYTENKVKTFIFSYCCQSTNPNLDTNEFQVALIDEEKIVKDINQYKKFGQVIVVFHWGDEEIKYPKVKDIQLAHRLIESGVSLIIGHHAHVIQSHEIYNNKQIYFGLGNFIFPDLNIKYQDYSGNTLTYRKKQYKRNRKSLVVDVNLIDFNVSERHCLFDKKKVLLKSGNLKRKLLNKDQYDKYCLRINRKQKIINFLKEPYNFKFSKLKRF